MDNVAMTPVPEETRELQTKATGMLAYAKTVSIETVELCSEAEHNLKQIADWKHQGGKLFDPSVKSAKEAYDDAKKLRSLFLDPIKTADTLIRQKVGGFRFKQRQIAEKKRIEAEAKAREEERILREKAEKEAKKAEKKGDKTKANNIRLNVPAVPIAQVEEEKPETKGVASNLKWFAVVEDVKKVPRKFLVPDMVKLNGRARETEGPSDIPGVRFVSEEKIIVRRNG